MLKEEGVKFMGRGGSGSEAKINIELRTEIPGIGGKIITQQAVVIALREEFNKEPKMGHKMFLRHTIIKKLEDYFQRKKIYQFSHIPRPLGSISRNGENPYEAYIYEWVFGSDSFLWEYLNPEEGHIFLKIVDWSEFGGAFDEAGIDLRTDCTDSDDGRCSQNIVHQFYNMSGDSKDFEINPLWKRIDFGYRSIKINYENLSRFLRDNREALRQVLRSERYDMMALSLEYLTNSNMDRLDIGRLDALVGNYRLASLSHYISRGVSVFERDALAHIGPREQSLV